MSAWGLLGLVAAGVLALLLVCVLFAWLGYSPRGTA